MNSFPSIKHLKDVLCIYICTLESELDVVHDWLWHRRSIKPEDVAYMLYQLLILVWNLYETNPKLVFKMFNIIALINQKYTIFNVFYLHCKITRDRQIRLKWWLLMQCYLNFRDNYKSFLQQVLHCKSMITL